MRKWFDNWQSVGHVVLGMNPRGLRLHLTNINESLWRVTF